jgi:hypothetical protein
MASIKALIADIDALTSINRATIKSATRQPWQALFRPKAHPVSTTQYYNQIQRQIPETNGYSFEAQLDLNAYALLNCGYIGQPTENFAVVRHLSHYLKPRIKPHNSERPVDSGELFGCHIQVACGHWIGYTITSNSKAFKVRKQSGMEVTVVMSAKDVAIADAKRRMKDVCSLCEGAQRPSAYQSHMATCIACQWYERAAVGSKQIA